MKYVNIDFLKYMHPRTYVLINPKFRKELFENAMKVTGTKEKLAKLIGSNKGTVNNWKNNKNYNRRKLPLLPLIKCCQILNLSTTELSRNIKYATLRYPAGDIKIKNWKIGFDEEFAEWFGMLNGDGSISDRDLSFSNTYFNLTLHFTRFLQKKFNINKDRITMTITYYTDNSLKEAKKISNQLKQKGYSKVKIYMAYHHKGKKINLKAQVCFKVLSQFLLNIKNDLINILNKSPINVKAAYLRGYSAAEGCASHVKSGSRYVTITQNNKKELDFIKSLLKDIGIERIDGPRWTGTAFRIATSNGADIERFQQKIGFGAHIIKNEKLKQMLNSYKQKRWCY
jgi:intein/homing endonuclease